MKKVLIIGANGFVGGYLIKEYLNNGYEVIAADMADVFRYEYSAKYEKINILDKDMIDTILKKYMPDYIINLAAISSVGLSWKMPQNTMNVNIIGTINILDSIKENVPNAKILLIGSSEEYIQKQEPLKEEDLLDANNPYGISKIAAENVAKMYLEKYGLNIVCTRSFNHTGVGQADNFAIPSFCKQVAEIEKSKAPGKIYVGNLSAYRDISDVRDVVKVYRCLLEEEKDLIYNVGSGKTYKMEDLLNYIISLSSQKIEVIVDKEKFRSVDTPYICCDNSKTAKYFDGTDIKDTIKEMYEYYARN